MLMRSNEPSHGLAIRGYTARGQGSTTTLIAPALGAAAARDRHRHPGERRDRRQLYGSRDAAAFPLLVRRADVLAEVGSDDEFEVGLNALLAGFRDLIEAGGRRRESSGGPDAGG
jgi:hypothetical protein